MVGFIYAGQGSQRVGMGKDFYEEYPLFAKTYDNAPSYVKGYCFAGPAETLGQTRYTQPCMVAFAVGVTNLLKEEGIVPDYACGLSLGEYSALYTAGVFTEEEVIDLVAFRGVAMEEAVVGRTAKMAAVLMMDRETIEACCKEAQENVGDGLIVSVANYNCPGQIVISGDEKAVDEAVKLLQEKGARKVIPLAVSGPFHTSLMKPAGDKLAKKFEEINFGEPSVKVVYNKTATEIKEGQTIQELLEQQVQSSVYLEDSIRYMISKGVDTFVEIGPGKSVSKFIKKIDKEVKVMSIDAVADYKEVVSALKGGSIE